MIRRQPRYNDPPSRFDSLFGYVCNLCRSLALGEYYFRDTAPYLPPCIQVRHTRHHINPESGNLPDSILKGYPALLESCEHFFDAVIRWHAVIIKIWAGV